MQGHIGKGGVTVEDIARDMEGVIDDLLQRIEGEAFTTTQFIELLRSVPEGEAAYQAAWRRWGEKEHESKMVIHGQVIPLVLRRSRFVQWDGYAHGEHDPYAVPAWWLVVPTGDAPQDTGPR
ncbi:MAG: hypothetical protein M3173_08820 [Chloroflexota bacterium]|nr:hypothetical protein [Chloroflexota bacterium]